MSLLLPIEQRTGRGRLFLLSVYGILILGALTMVYPFFVMLTASVSSSYDYARHAPFLKALASREDRFMRSIATFFPSFPHAVFPAAPAAWNTWSQVAKDTSGVRAFAQHYLLCAQTNKTLFAEWKKRAIHFRKTCAAWDLTYTTCTYDARDVEPFLARTISLDELNRTGSVHYRSFFDVSFSAESKLPLGHPHWTPPTHDVKYRLWLAFKDSYRQKMCARGAYVCRTLPFLEKSTLTPEQKQAYYADLRAALAIQFLEHGTRDFVASCCANYRLVAHYLFSRGRAFWNTLLLVVLSVLAHLTVNPLAAYALSRFQLKGTEKILLFMLATMAFPTAVTAIPGFLLVRDLGLLNTLAALVLPTLTSGMSIFILKGFFDALPRELYEAAEIDGASERLVFWKITLPLTTPILAVNALNSFIAAYNSWEWALLVCQKESHWTLAVWMYQMSQQMGAQPWCVMAGFVLVSIPTALVFWTCQKVILRGIVLPSLK